MSMRRCLSSLPRENGSALIEAVAIGSVIFLVVASALVSSIRVTIAGTEAREAARVGAVHAARHDGVAAAKRLAGTLFPGASVHARRDADSVAVSVVNRVILSHPAGAAAVEVVGSARVPLAPFRSRG